MCYQGPLKNIVKDGMKQNTAQVTTKYAHWETHPILMNVTSWVLHWPFSLPWNMQPQTITFLHNKIFFCSPGCNVDSRLMLQIWCKHVQFGRCQWSIHQFVHPHHNPGFPCINEILLSTGQNTNQKAPSCLEHGIATYYPMSKAYWLKPKKSPKVLNVGYLNVWFGSKILQC